MIWLLVVMMNVAEAFNEAAQMEAANAVDNVYHLSANGYCWWWKDYYGPYTSGNEAFLWGISTAAQPTMTARVEACRDNCLSMFGGETGNFFSIAANHQWKCICSKPVSDGGPSRCVDRARRNPIPDVVTGEDVPWTGNDDDPNYRFSYTGYLNGGGTYGLGENPFPIIECSKYTCPSTHKKTGVDCEGACDDDQCCTHYDDLPACGENEHVVNHECTACPAGKHKPAGDKRSSDTQCWDDGTCGGVVCLDANTESCDNYSCMCKSGFQGRTCKHSKVVYDPATHPDEYKYLSIYDGTPGKGDFLVTIGGQEYQIKTKFQTCGKTNMNDPYDFLPITSDIEMLNPPDSIKTNGYHLCTAIWDQTRCVSGSAFDCTRAPWAKGVFWKQDWNSKDCWSDNRAGSRGGTVYAGDSTLTADNDVDWVVLHCIDPIIPPNCEDYNCPRWHLKKEGVCEDGCTTDFCCTALTSLPACGENEHVVDHECVACPEGTHRLAGDKRTRNTECWDDASCGGDMCVEDNTESCVDYACVCKAGFSGTTCDKDVSARGVQNMLNNARKKALPTPEEIQERQNVIKNFVRDTLKQKLKQGATLKSAIEDTKIQVTPQDLPQRAQLIMTQVEKPPAIAVAPPNSDVEDTCSQGANSPGCGMVDIDQESNDTIILTTDPEPGSWTVLTSAGTIVSKQIRVSEFVFEMQCWTGSGWGASSILNVTDGALLFECNGNVIMIGSQAGICTSSTCKNGGTCIVDGQFYVCNCTVGWTGKHCETEDTSSYCFEFPCHDYGGFKTVGPCGQVCSASACCNYASKSAFDLVCDATTNAQQYVDKACCHRTFCS